MAAASEAVEKHSDTEIMQACVHFIEFDKGYVLAQNSEGKGRALVTVSVSLNIF